MVGGDGIVLVLVTKGSRVLHNRSKPDGLPARVFAREADGECKWQSAGMIIAVTCVTLTLSRGLTCLHGKAYSSISIQASHWPS